MINLWAPICDTGYGLASFNILKQLDCISRVALYPIGKPHLESEEDMEIVKKCLNNRDSFNKNSTCIKIWHQNDLYSRIGSGKYIGFPIFELDSFDKNETLSLMHCDELFVCSQWAKNVILKNLKYYKEDKVHVVPLGVNTEVFYPYVSTNRQTTVFFNCGKWSKNKGHDILLKAFNMAFNHDDDVELWMMCDNVFIGDQGNKEWQRLYKTSKLGEKIRFIPRQPHHSDVARIMNMTDCGIFPARGEGWNMELLEMMACGKHTIATNYSGHTEFCNENNCKLINTENLETAFDGVFFDGTKGFWAELSDEQVDQTVTHMRDIHNKKQSNELGFNTDGIKTAKYFSWNFTLQNIMRYV